MRLLESKSNGKQRGIAMTEFAIVVPIFLLLMLATAELGRALYQYNTLTKAVRDGARYLSVHALEAGVTGPDKIDAADKTAAANLVAYGTVTEGDEPLLPGLSAGDVTCEAIDDENVRCAAEYVYTPIFAGGLPTFGFGSGTLNTLFTFTSAVTMRALE
jgi:Flp pilus assembly protein TadG